MESSTSTWRPVIRLADGQAITFGGGLEMREAIERASDYAANCEAEVEYASACRERQPMAIFDS